jgi:hypothetical protein
MSRPGLLEKPRPVISFYSCGEFGRGWQLRAAPFAGFLQDL